VARVRTAFERQLREVQDEVLSLGSMVERAVLDSVDALKRRDLDRSRRIIADDAVIDRKRYGLEERCIQIIAMHQPMATDLRALVAFLYITDELERMADYAEGIGKISLMMGEQPPLKPLVDLPRMAEIGVSMSRGALEALVERDPAKAKAVIDRDDEVDNLYDRIFRDLVALMISDPQTIDRASYLTWAAHNLERFADRTTNIAERVIFLVTGQLPQK
jgi:phosphate transport system protein